MLGLIGTLVVITAAVAHGGGYSAIPASLVVNAITAYVAWLIRRSIRPRMFAPEVTTFVEGQAVTIPAGVEGGPTEGQTISLGLMHLACLTGHIALVASVLLSG